MSDSRWEHFQHVADIGVRGRAADLAGAFEQAAIALTAVITEPERVKPQRAFSFHCRADNNDILLLDWLNALIYEMAISKVLFSRFDVSIDGHELNATAWGEAIDITRHQPGVEIKGATLTALEVAQDEQGIWTAQCVVDV